MTDEALGTIGVRNAISTLSLIADDAEPVFSESCEVA
jgi:hypothetical protein